MKYWFEPRFEDKKKLEDGSAILDSEELNALSSWELVETGLYAA